MRWTAVLVLAGLAWAGELDDAAARGDLAKVEELVRAGAKKSLAPLLNALRNGHGEVALLLAREGFPLRPELVAMLERSKFDATCIPALWTAIRGRDAMVVPAATIAWLVGPHSGAGAQLVKWLDKDGPERRAAMLALRRAAGEDPDVLAALAKHEDSCESLGWNGFVTAPVVLRLAAGIRAKRRDALIACTRMDWPKKPDDATNAALKELRAAIGSLGKDPLAREAKLALLGRFEPSVAGDPRGRAVRRAKKSNRIDEKAVALGLDWLARHQDEDGRWNADDFRNHDPADDKCDGPGGALYDVGVTSLALLAFLAEGHTPFTNTEHSHTVDRGLQHLLASMDNRGCFGSRVPPRFPYNAALATHAMCEAAALTGYPAYEQAARSGAAFLARARNRNDGWGYRPRGGDATTALTIVCLRALQVARVTGLADHGEAILGGLSRLEAMRDDRTGRIGYKQKGHTPSRPEGLQERFPFDKTESLTAGGTLCLELAGRRGSIGMFASMPPAWNPDDGSIDMIYWTWGTLATHQHGGQWWRDWRKVVADVIPKHQHARGSGARTGSWDPIGVWGADGGRVYSTAMMVLTLQTAYRYSRTSR